MATLEISHEETKSEGQFEVEIFGGPVAMAPENAWPKGEPGDVHPDYRLVIVAKDPSHS